MNVTLCDVTLTDPNGNRYYYDNFFLKSRLIRYVHISRSVSSSIEILIYKYFNTFLCKISQNMLSKLF